MIRADFEFITSDLNNCKCEVPDIYFDNVYNTDNSFGVDKIKNLSFDTSTYIDSVIVKGNMEIDAEEEDIVGKQFYLSAEAFYSNISTELNGCLTLKIA